jgi:hypothetical protein
MADKYRKKPVEIEAMQWDGTRVSIDAICDWVNGGDDNYDDPTITYCYSGVDDVNDVRIWTLEGDLNVSPNDYVIRGVQGEFYPCKPDIFGQTYDKVN